MNLSDDGVLKFAAVQVLDTTQVKVYSATYYVPCGFQLKVKGDSILVDAFPCPPIVKTKEKRKWIHGEIDCGVSLAEGKTYIQDTAQNVSVFTTRPYIAARVALGPVRLGRTYWSLIPGQISWTYGVIGYAAFLRAGEAKASAFPLLHRRIFGYNLYMVQESLGRNFPKLNSKFRSVLMTEPFLGGRYGLGFLARRYLNNMFFGQSGESSGLSISPLR